MAQIHSVPPIAFRNVDGHQFTLQSLLTEGPVLIDFWALWCTPCLKALRHLDAIQAEFVQSGLTVVAVNLDTERSRSKVHSYVRSRGYRFQVALDPSQEIFRRLNGKTLPYTLLVDQAGKVAYRHIGYTPGDERILRREVAQLLKNQHAPTVQPPPDTSLVPGVE